MDIVEYAVQEAGMIVSDETTQGRVAMAIVSVIMGLVDVPLSIH